MNTLTEAIHTVSYMNGSGKLLVGAEKAGFIERFLDYGRLEFRGKISTLISQRARAIGVLSDSRPLPKEGMVIPRDRLRVFGHQEFGPVTYFVVVAGPIRIAFEGKRVFQIRKLLVAE